MEFKDVEARVKEGGTDDEIVEWIFSRGLRPNRTQAMAWNEHSRKLGWNDRMSSFVSKVKESAGLGAHPACTTFELIDLGEEREPPVKRE